MTAPLCTYCDVLHAVLVVVSMMDERDTLDVTLVFRASMPTLAPLFHDGEERITLRVAVHRAMAYAEGRP